MSKLRFRVVETAFKKKPVAVAVPAERPSEYFAKYVFNKEKMFRYLPSKVYAKLTDVIDNGAPLDRSIADEVAAGTACATVSLSYRSEPNVPNPIFPNT